MADAKLPLFPLGLVLMPGMPLPLHIFEDRYKRMIGECLETGSEFGIVFYQGSSMEKVGCTARIMKVLRRYEDGRMDIITRGERRFEIEDLVQEKPYLEAEVTFFEDAWEAPTEETEALARQGVDLLRQVGNLTEEEVDEILEEDLDVREFSYLIAGSDGFTAEEKQEFIEMTSARERLRKSVEALGKIVKRVEITNEIKKIIDGNGHLPEHLLEDED